VVGAEEANAEGAELGEGVGRAPPIADRLERGPELNGHRPRPVRERVTVIVRDRFERG
jgi:hypothetical protein